MSREEKSRLGISAKQPSYQDAVNLLISSGKFRISLGLERIEKILALLDNPQNNLDCIHVAGTNGKGSVCAILSSILTTAGKKVGLYTSPHLFRYTERIQISGEQISDEDFANYVFKISELADKNNVDLTEFEILTAVMFKYFADNGVSVVVLETGLGGRYDATNVIKKNLCSIITHIDFDHTERLGDTLDKIAYEKAGIIKPNCPCIVFEGKEIYYDVASSVGAPLQLILPMVSADKLSLKGLHQQENLSLALAAIELLFPEILQSTIDSALEKVKHPFRFQYFAEKNLIIDGAHNPNGINLLRQNLDFYYQNVQKRFIFGCLNNKDYKQMIECLFNYEDEIYFYEFAHSGALTYDEFSKVCSLPHNQLSRNTQIDYNDGKLTVICGSLYMIGELVKLFDLAL
ncbi:MAG: bifunctional folylpolyglutamate synthase/dihydrofolate synthase [Cyanobacteria bacterium SIG26]|nr:bifunctional folylpolyglutamate synthase/dihydrofolate synthase [Cyanobacteria bacterium SIG26]